jgi:hypothetical protein
MKKLLLINLLLLLAICGCSREEDPVDIPKPTPEKPDVSIVVANCRTLQTAVEQFAEENDGVFPGSVDADTSLAGNTVLDLLPESGLLDNPFTKTQTVPLNGAADSSGEVGYEPVRENDWNVGYLITGFGEDSLVSELTNIGSPEEAKVRANCLIVQKAAEDCAARYGAGYPSEVCDEDLSNPISYYLRGYRLENPFTGIEGVPTPHTASSPGEIGYVAITRNGERNGFVVTGFGADSVIIALTNLEISSKDAIVVSDSRTLQRTVEQYAAQNGSLYPNTIECPAGVEYEVVAAGGRNIGYKISGFGEDAKVIELTNIESPEEATVRLECLVLKYAIEQFAAMSDGRFPEDVDVDTTPGGQTVIDLLPGAQLLENPYAGNRDNPKNYSASLPGEIGYAVVQSHPDEDPCVPPVDEGYVITGYAGKSIEVAITNLDFPPGEAIVLSHCRTVQLAVERWAVLNGGLYPSDVDCHATPGGQTVVDLLPGRSYLVNPFTRAATEPVNGHAANAGEIGYVPNTWNGENGGYAITGTGREAGATIRWLVKDYCPARAHR